MEVGQLNVVDHMSNTKREKLLRSTEQNPSLLKAPKEDGILFSDSANGPCKTSYKQNNTQRRRKTQLY